MKASILITVVLCFTAKLAFPCSAIVLKHNDQILLAKNFDWTLHDGMIIKNLRGTSKTVLKEIVLMSISCIHLM